MQISKIIAKLKNLKNLSTEESYALQNEIINGKASKEAIMEIFRLFEKKEMTDEELTGILKATREKMVRVAVSFPCLDNCGTGGDGFNTFNISTVSAVVCAAAGIPVAKHGNRAASSKCGSADVLEKLGVKINLDAGQAKNCFLSAGIVFMFAPNFHPALKFVKEARFEYGKKTYFNILGPMLNPAGAAYQLIGLSDASKTSLIGKTLIASGSKRVMIIRGDEGLDEISVENDTLINDFKTNDDGADFSLKQFKINPRDFGLNTHPLNEIRGGDPTESAKIFLDILKNEAGAARIDAVLLNSAAGALTFGRVNSFEEGIELAREMIASGKALRKLKEFIKISNSL
ncbi:MAG: anthranilate phosphoribosyltransferase [Patescibacteria group bacterium]|jgi:anthranilate phosphoribosyltransferase